MENTVGSKKRWYREWFGEEYLSVYAHRNLSDAKKLIDLIIRTLPLRDDDLALDVGCGNARHSKLLARQGFRVIGIDLSRVLLESARAGKEQKFPFLLLADMRRLPFRDSFDAVLSLFTSFGYFQSDQMNRQVLDEFYFVLKDGGKILLDFLNPDYVAKHLEPSTEKITGKLSVRETRWIDAGRVYKKIIINDNKEFLESVRLFSLNEMTEMLTTTGFKTDRVFGDYHGNDFTNHSERMIIKAIK